MTAIEELEMTARSLSERLEKAANDDRKFSTDIQLLLERMSWEIMRHADDLQEIQSYI